MKATVKEIESALRQYVIPADNEAAMQSVIERVLKIRRFDYNREVVLSDADRIDFMVGAIGIECKVAGTAGAVMLQCGRYLDHDAVESLILVTTKATHRRICYDSEKPFCVVVVGGF
jgi:hypothetical protein